jgi:hypothetical protein
MIVVPVMSNPTGAWSGKKGYVQAALKEDGVRVPRNTGKPNTVRILLVVHAVLTIVVSWDVPVALCHQ